MFISGFNWTLKMFNQFGTKLDWQIGFKFQIYQFFNAAISKQKKSATQ